jgi:hypothetical protein
VGRHIALVARLTPSILTKLRYCSRCCLGSSVLVNLSVSGMANLDGNWIGVAICVHGAGSCRVGSYISTIWVNPNTTRLLIVSGYVNPNTTRLLNGLTRHDSHNPFNKQVVLG